MWNKGNVCCVEGITQFGKVEYASVMWNQSGGTTLNAGVIPTPNSLANAIIGTGSYNVNEQFTAISTVYYNATTPIVSSEHN